MPASTETAALPNLRDAMRVDWPEGEHGTASLRRFTVTDEHALFERVAAFSSGGRGVPAGEYTGLYINGHLWMSDTPDEMRDHLSFLWAAEARKARRVLVNGLGLGMVARALAVMPHVEHVDVCDNNADVVALVGPHLQKWGAEHGTTINIVLGVAHEPSKLYPTGTRWDAAWHDIWPNICADNWESMKTLRRRYGRRCSEQSCWSEGLTKRAVDQSRRDERLYSMFRR